jgi:hypothetical protein
MVNQRFWNFIPGSGLLTYVNQLNRDIEAIQNLGGGYGVGCWGVHSF